MARCYEIITSLDDIHPFKVLDNVNTSDMNIIKVIFNMTLHHARSKSTRGALGMDGSLQAASAAFITVRGTPTSMMAEEGTAVDGWREVDVDIICYLVDRLGTEGGADAAGTAWMCAWKKF